MNYFILFIFNQIFYNIFNIFIMKFAQLLMKSMIPEWIKLYLNYSLLKNYLSSSALLKKYFKQLKIKFKKKKIY